MQKYHNKSLLTLQRLSFLCRILDISVVVFVQLVYYQVECFVDTHYLKTFASFSHGCSYLVGKFGCACEVQVGSGMSHSYIRDRVVCKVHKCTFDIFGLINPFSILVHECYKFDKVAEQVLFLLVIILILFLKKQNITKYLLLSVSNFWNSISIFSQ